MYFSVQSVIFNKDVYFSVHVYFSVSCSPSTKMCISLSAVPPQQRCVFLCQLFPLNKDVYFSVSCSPSTKMCISLSSLSSSTKMCISLSAVPPQQRCVFLCPVCHLQRRCVFLCQLFPLNKDVYFSVQSVIFNKDVYFSVSCSPSTKMCISLSAVPPQQRCVFLCQLFIFSKNPPRYMCYVVCLSIYPSMAKSGASSCVSSGRSVFYVVLI